MRPEDDRTDIIAVTMSVAAAEKFEKALGYASSRDGCPDEHYDWLSWGRSRVFNARLDHVGPEAAFSSHEAGEGV